MIQEIISHIYAHQSARNLDNINNPMAATCEEVWNNCLQVIRDNVSPQSFQTWFEPIRPVKLEGKSLTIQVPSLFFFEWLEEHYVELLKKTIKKELGVGARLDYNIVVENSSSTRNHSNTVSLPGSQHNQRSDVAYRNGQSVNGGIKNPFVIPGIQKSDVDSQLNPHFNFDAFVEGECNRLARSAGMAVASKPGGTSFNPLMVYGGVGLGKTHLAQAIGLKVKELHRQKAVLYVSSEKFTNQFIESLKTNSVNDFINFYQILDVLVLDDVQFFSNKERTQDIFFHIFNHLHQGGKQLILTSDRPPRDLKGMEERLLSRFKWGLSADLTVPDFETRVAILEQKMYADGIELPREVVEYVAYNVDTSIRELEGVLISLLAHASLNRQEVDLKLAKEILRNFVKDARKELSIEQIQELIAKHHNLDVQLLRANTRKRHIVQARHIAMYCAKHFTGSSLTKIGEHFGGRDHSTVIHACKTVEDLMDTDSKFKAQVDEIQKLISVNLG